MYSSLVIFFSFLALTVVGKDVELPRFTVDLDQPPEQRWTDIATQYTKELKETVAYFAVTYDELYAMLSILGGDVDKYIPDSYAGEIKGIASATGITAGEILFINIIYGLTAFGRKSSSSKSLLGCTSIVSQTESGHILHGRNLDYGISLLRDLAINVDFQVSEVTTFTATTFAGYVGVLTGQKPNSFTISLDERDQGDWHGNVIEAQKLGTRGFVSFKIRDLLEDDLSDFEKVVNTIAKTQFIAPFYAIVGGVSGDEGAIITHNRTTGIDVWRLNSTENRWFILETNYDHWTPPPKSDDRRDPANEMMNDTGLSNISSDSIFKILSTPPVLNNGTIFTVLMSAADPTLYTGWIRNPDDS